MKTGIFILGNGFDLDLGLKTKYVDFARSRFWEDLMKNNAHRFESSRLLGFLREKYAVENWIDIEAALLEYALLKTQNGEVQHAEEDKIDFFLLCDALKEYLKDQQNSFEPTRNSVAKELLRRFPRLAKESALYSFNYTLLGVLSLRVERVLGLGMREDAIHIHGSLRDGDELILGIETPADIREEYAFLYKTQNRQYGHTDILRDLNDKDEYIFFGHSLNGMDYTYFSSLFQRLTIRHQSPPRLTIITKSVEDENRFKIFLRKNHVSLQELYSNSIPTFVLTDEIYKQNVEEMKKYEALLLRINEMSGHSIHL